MLCFTSFNLLFILKSSKCFSEPAALLEDLLLLKTDERNPSDIWFDFIVYTRGHSRILIKGVRNTHGTGLIVGNDGNCKMFW